MNARQTIIPSALTALFLLLAAPHSHASHYDGGRVTPKHLLPLSNEDGDVIVPGDPSALPPSTEQTCGQCHDLTLIKQGFHFAQTNVCLGLTEPWFWVDAQTASQIPISLRPGDGRYAPEALGLSSWDFTRLFGRHLPGGGLSAPTNTIDQGGRWEVTGRAEMNCFACHAQNHYDHSEYVRQMERQNWRWASTAATGLGDVLGMGSRMQDSWCPMLGSNPDDKVFAIAPSVRYHTHLFDAKNRVDLQVGRPKDVNCLNCHSVAPVGAKRLEQMGDVHTHAGLKCVDCHRNDLSHSIHRGVASDSKPEVSTCSGCHANGYYGAPKPIHRGIPLIHFQKLACTVCHSSSGPNQEPQLVRTAKANRIGVYGRAIWATDLPHILEPVYVANEQGVIEPRRMMWPSFWAERSKDGTLLPLTPEAVQAVLGDTLAVRKRAGSVLRMIGENDNLPGQVALAIDGKLFTTDDDGGSKPLGQEVTTIYLYGYEESTFRDTNQSVPAVGTFVVRLIDGKAYVAMPSFDANEALSEQLYTAISDQLITMDNAATNRSAALLWQGKLFRRQQVENVTTNTDGRVEVTLPWLVQATSFAGATNACPQLGWYVNGTFEPLYPEEDARELLTLGDTNQIFTEALIKRGIDTFAKLGRSVAFIGAGKRFEVQEGALVACDDPLAQPVSWRISHDVRPARQALGASPERCADCHTETSNFFFRSIRAAGPLLTAQALTLPQYTFMRVEGNYHRLFGFTFRLRPLFKFFLWGATGIFLLALFALSLTVVPKLIDGTQTLGQLPAAQWCNRAAEVLIALTVGYQALSGLGGWLVGGMTQWVLIGHQLAAGGLVGALLVKIVCGSLLKVGTSASYCRLALWGIATVGLILTALSSMLNTFGSDGQLGLLNLHRGLALLLILAVLTSLRQISRRP